MPIQRAKPRIADLDQTPLTSIANTDLPAGSILQVKQDVKTDASYASGSGYVNYLSLDITPAATSSKFLIMCQLSISGVERYHITRLYRRVNSVDTEIATGDNGSNNSRQECWMVTGTGEGTNKTYEQRNSFGSYLDSPSTTSTITYKVDVGVYAAHAYGINRSHYGLDNSSWNSAPITNLTVIEIAG